MSAPIAKTELAFKLPESLSYHSTWDDADYEPVLPSRHQGALTRLAIGLRARLVRWRARQVAIRELSGLTDRDLADIGLSRSDIPRVTDAGFVAERGATFTARA